MKKIATLAIILTLLVTSCQKWDTELTVDQNGLIKRVEDESHQVVAEYEYNSNGTLKSSWEHNDLYINSKNAKFNYKYNTDELLIEKSGFEPGNMIMSSITGASDKDITTTYNYDDQNRISKIVSSVHIIDFDEADFSTQLAFEYPDNKTVINKFNLIDELANSVISGTEFQFEDGNIITKLNFYYLDNERRITSKEEYTYDNKKAPVSFEPGPKSTNNILSLTITAYNYDESGNQSIAYTSEYTYEYTYNSNNYPEKVTETYPNEQTNIKYYTYY